MIDKEFVEHLQALADDQCECSRSNCHAGPGRCPETLVDTPGLAKWVAYRTVVSEDGKASSSYFIALCGHCATRQRTTRHSG
jgi:hypothetical protein